MQYEQLSIAPCLKCGRVVVPIVSETTTVTYRSTSSLLGGMKALVNGPLKNFVKAAKKA